MNDFLCNAGGMDEDQRQRVGEYVRTQRMHRYGTVDAARIEAGVSRGAWDAVEQGKPVRDFTYGKVEKALELPAGYLDALAKGQSELMEAMVDGDAIFKELMEWASKLVPGRAPEPPPTSALIFWSTEQLLEALALREQGYRENVRWHVERYKKLKARLDALLSEDSARPDPPLSARDQRELEELRHAQAQAAVRAQHSTPDEPSGDVTDAETEVGR